MNTGYLFHPDVGASFNNQVSYCYQNHVERHIGLFEHCLWLWFNCKLIFFRFSAMVILVQHFQAIKFKSRSLTVDRL